MMRKADPQTCADGLTISDLRSDEIPAAVALWEEAGLLRPWNDPRADAELALRSADSTILAARRDAELVATIMVGHDGHRGWIYYLAVAHILRRRGIGKRLMQVAEQWCVSRGVPKLQLMVRGENVEVTRFYAALGYSRSDVVVLAKRLPSPNT
ncbi:MAG: GNAT family acetyltransferase [Beijerinckiaceae bacterium]